MINIVDFKIDSNNKLIAFAYIEDIMSESTLINESFTIYKVELKYDDTTIALIDNGNLVSSYKDYVTMDVQGKEVSIELPLDSIENILGYNALYHITITASGSTEEEESLPCSYSRSEYAIAYNKCVVGRTLLDYLKRGVCDTSDLNKIVNVLALEHAIDVLDYDIANQYWKTFFANSSTNAVGSTYNCGCNA